MLGNLGDLVVQTASQWQPLVFCRQPTWQPLQIFVQRLSWGLLNVRVALCVAACPGNGVHDSALVAQMWARPGR